MKLSNGTYDLLKKIALIIVPVCTFLATLGDIWGIPHNVEIASTLAALDTLIGALLQISSMNYYKGESEDELD